VLPGIGPVGASPLPVETMIWPEPSDTSPLPDCQIPDPLSEPGVAQRALIVPLVDTPTIQPRQGSTSQWLPKPA
jgi:hypothetical protein